MRKWTRPNYSKIYLNDNNRYVREKWNEYSIEIKTLSGEIQIYSITAENDREVEEYIRNLSVRGKIGLIYKNGVLYKGIIQASE